MKVTWVIKFVLLRILSMWNNPKGNECKLEKSNTDEFTIADTITNNKGHNNQYHNHAPFLENKQTKYICIFLFNVIISKITIRNYIQCYKYLSTIINWCMWDGGQREGMRQIVRQVRRERLPSQMHITDKNNDNSFLDLLFELHGTSPKGKFWLQHQIFYHLHQTGSQQTCQNGCHKKIK